MGSRPGTAYPYPSGTGAAEGLGHEHHRGGHKELEDMEAEGDSAVHLSGDGEVCAGRWGGVSATESWGLRGCFDLSWPYQ